MPSPIELDTKHWVRVVPSGRSQAFKCLNFACYYSNEAEPPEKASEGTELAVNASLTIENPSGRWFRAKEPSSTEAPAQPSILEAQFEKPESIGTIQLEAGAVTEPKIGTAAVAPLKVKAAVAPVATGTESLTAELGAAGVTRTVIAVYNAKAEASAKVKIKHGLNTEYVAVTAWKASAKKATERIIDGAAVAGAISKVKMESAEEILVTLVATEPTGKDELFYVVQG